MYKVIVTVSHTTSNPTLNNWKCHYNMEECKRNIKLPHTPLLNYQHEIESKHKSLTLYTKRISQVQ